MSRADLLKKINRAISTNKVDFSAFDVELNRIKKSLEETVNIQTVDDVSRKLKQFQSKIDFSPLLAELEKIRSITEEATRGLEKKITEKNKELLNAIETKNEEDTARIEKEVSDLKLSLEGFKASGLSSLVTDIEETKRKFNEATVVLTNNVNSRLTKEEARGIVKEIQDTVESVRLELIKRLGRGGSMPVTTIGASVNSGTSGSILYVDSSGKLAQNNAQLKWDATNLTLIIGAPTALASPANTSLIVAANSNTSFNPTTGVFQQLEIEGAGANSLYRLSLGVRTVANAGNVVGTGTIQALSNGSAFTPLLLNPSAGAVAVGSGTSTPGTFGRFEGWAANGAGTNVLSIGVVDSTAQAAGTGGGIAFAGKYDSVPNYTTAGAVRAEKTNATDGNYSFGLAFYTRNSGAGTVRNMLLDNLGNLTLATKLLSYNGITTVSNGIPSEVATIDSTGLTANVGATTLYAVPASGAGLYRVSAYLVTTTAASITSTMPNAQVVYTDSDSNTSVTLDVSPILGAAGLGQSGLLTANTVGTVFSGTVVVYIKASTTIQYQTVNYASNIAGMTYAFRMKLEAL